MTIDTGQRGGDFVLTHSFQLCNTIIIRAPLASNAPRHQPIQIWAFFNDVEVYLSSRSFVAISSAPTRLRLPCEPYGSRCNLFTHGL
jgi:hypothetical protein